MKRINRKRFTFYIFIDAFCWYPVIVRHKPKHYEAAFLWWDAVLRWDHQEGQNK